MPELRWILLIVGALFIAALAWWEIRRQRQSPSQTEERTPPRQREQREPTLGLPEIRPRETPAELPIVEISDESLIGLRLDGVRIEEDMQAAEPPLAEPPVTEPPVQATRVATLPEPEPSSEPIVQWPPEDQRKLLAVRVVAQPGARFAGRALRLALAAEGFVLGKFSIFHKPGPDARVLVSAASIAQPGTFDLDTMDTHRYGGLGLFAVLPGPLPAPQMFDELVKAARVLNERLQGALQDERGEPLTATRINGMREKLEAELGS